MIFILTIKVFYKYKNTNLITNIVSNEINKRNTIQGNRVDYSIEKLTKSGHVDLAKKTGATIIFGPGAETAYSAYIAKDNETFKIGNITIKVLHTPGHTLESSTFLLID